MSKDGDMGEPQSSDFADRLRRKKARRRRLNTKTFPGLRINGLLMVGLLASIHLVLVNKGTLQALWSLWLGLTLYGAFATSVLKFGYSDRGFRRHLATVLFVIDLPIFCWVIAMTGGPGSYLFPILLVRVADQAHFSFKRAGLFCVLACCCYLGMLSLWAGAGYQVDWIVESCKVITLYVCGLFIAVTGRTSESLRRRLIEAIATADKVGAELQVNLVEQRRLTKELDGHRDHLEELVSERTHELESALGTLQEREQRISWQNQELETANRLKTEFLANMSHELRTPLNGIIGFSDVLKDGLVGELNDQQLDYTQEINTSGRHLLSLVNDILDLSKIEAGKIDITVEEIKPGEICEEVVSAFRERAQRGQLDLNLDLRSEINPFRSDRRKLKQVLFNLLDNAVKFTPEGGSVTLRVELKKRATRISFSVEDTGIGISEQNMDKLFVSFQQVDGSATREYGGTGLGLALCKRFLELQKGEITAHSEFGKGSRFEAILPYPG